MNDLKVKYYGHPVRGIFLIKDYLEFGGDLVKREGHILGEYTRGYIAADGSWSRYPAADGSSRKAKFYVLRLLTQVREFAMLETAFEILETFPLRRSNK